MKRRWALGFAVLATALWLWFIYSRSAKPAVVSHEESTAVLGLFQRVLPFLDLFLVRKLAHFIEYFILGALLWLDWRLSARGTMLLPLGVGLLAAGADEYLQTFIPGRSGQISDVLLDFCGVAAAIVLAQLLWRRKERGAHANGSET